MKERPILFSGPMVRALLDGRKTQTRRVCNPQPVKNGAFWELYGAAWSSDTIPVPVMPGHSLAVRGPFGCAGDRIWVRETWQYADWTEDGYPFIGYAADGHKVLVEDAPEEWSDRLLHIWADLSRDENYKIDGRAGDRNWRPSIHMPRWACRILLEITDVRVQRLQEISEQDAIDEGTPPRHVISDAPVDWIDSFMRLWNSIYAEHASWDSNPWVWAITFKVIT